MLTPDTPIPCAGRPAAWESTRPDTAAWARHKCGQCPALEACGRLFNDLDKAQRDMCVGTWAGETYESEQLIRQRKAAQVRMARNRKKQQAGAA